MDDEVRFLDILSELARHGVEFIVVGGVAAILEGVPMTTFDLDIVYHRTPENNNRLTTALIALNASYRDPAGRRLLPDANKLETIKVHLLHTDRGPLDVLFQVGEGLGYERLLERTNTYEVDSVQIRVLDLETIILSKEFANREKDRAVLPMLRRALRLKRQVE